MLLVSYFLVFLAAIPRGFGQHMEQYNRYQFERNVRTAMEDVNFILEKERHPQLLEHQEHEYADKFALVEQQTHALWKTLESIFGRLGLDLGTIDSRQGLHLYFEGKTTCDFVEEKEMSWSAWITAALASNAFSWNVTESYAVYTCAGDCEDGRVELKQRSVSTTVVTKAKRPPVQELELRNVLEKTNITWWAAQMKESAYSFSIDRSLASCKTPRRNKDVEGVLEFHTRLFEWCSQVIRFLRGAEGGSRLTTMPGLQHVPPSLLPLLENSTILSSETLGRFLKLEQAALDDKLQWLTESFDPASPSTILSSEEAILNELVGSMRESVHYYALNVDYVEDVLEKQLISAIGRQLTPTDFQQFMNFHLRKLLVSDFASQHFSYAIRRPNQYPVGIASIESGVGDNEPIQTFSRRISGEGQPPLLIPIDAATSVEMTGDRVLSGWIRYQFSDGAGAGAGTGAVNLVARARQFSSYMLLLGTMTGPNSFDPKHAIILQNKDEVIIPLLAEVLPSAKAFKDAIASLSPEQQEFAKAFRAMQLESSVFAICLIQLKPQMERLLNMPDNALAKEIKLSEDLMMLFVDYQIPSDLLSYDGPAETSVTNKVQVVKTYVDQVLQVITATKKEQLKEEQDRGEMGPVTPPNTPPMCGPTSPESFSYSDPPSNRASASRSAYPSSGPTTPPTASASSHPTTPPTVESVSSTQKRRRLEEGSSAKTQADPVFETFPGKTDGEFDVTSIPARLDALLEEHDTEAYLRSTILKASAKWSRKRQPNLLSAPKHESLGTEIALEKKKAFDLLDAISRSGTLPIASAELHVVIGMTHCFTHSLIETVIRDNINPIAKAELSALMVASTIHNVSASDLLADDDSVKRLSVAFPALFEGDEDRSGQVDRKEARRK